MYPTSKHFRVLSLTFLILLLSALLLSGCSLFKSSSSTPEDSSAEAVSGNVENQNALPNSSAAENPQSPSVSEQIKLTIYFPTPDGDGLVAVNRTVTVTNNDRIQAIFQELSNPPSGSYNPLPKGTKLLSSAIQNGVATLNLSKEFQKNFTGGSAGEEMTYFSIVNSLTSLPNIESVQFLLEGEKLDAILGNYATTKPMKRNTSLIR